MGGALFWGLVGVSSLIVGGAFALRFRISQRSLGLVMGFGSGVLISAVAYELAFRGHCRDDRPGPERLGGAKDRRPLGRGRRRLRSGGARRLCLPRRSGSRPGRVRPLVRGWRRPDDAGRHDDARGVPARRLTGVVTTFGFAVAFALSVLD
jgi:hypothetical protein